MNMDHECGTYCVHRESVDQARRALPPDDVLQQLGELFKIFGDPSRLKILSALGACELCVCDIAALTGMSDSAVSHQLRILRNTRLVRYRKQGRIVYYSLIDSHIFNIIAQGSEHVAEKMVLAG
jgi:ArsR family transcriptional regulator